MKFIGFSALFYVLLSNSIFAETFLTKSEILRKSKLCLKEFQYQECNNLILEMEQLQVVESENNRYKCQSSILGLQTELIEINFFKKLKKNNYGILIPHVIKNC